MKKFFSIMLTIIFICLFCCSCQNSKERLEENKKLQVKIFCNYETNNLGSKGCSGTIQYSGRYGNLSDLINSIDNIVDIKMESITEPNTSTRGHIHYLVLYEENVQINE